MTVWDASQWDYRGEGNANLVIYYIGCAPELVGKALRLRKIKTTSCTKAPQCQEDARTCVDILHNVFKPLIGKEYTTNMEAVELPAEFLESAVKLSQRKDVNELARFGLLGEDLLNSSVAVEVKPKWGFLPQVEGLKQKACRFCMHSHLRGSPSHYCPLDLYSGDRERVKTALQALAKCPSNNYRVLVNTPFTDEALMSLMTEILTTDPILCNLVKLQMSLDEWDVERIWPLYEKHKHEVDNLTTEQWIEAVQNFKNGQCRDNPKQRIMEYVLSMTFKDCSVMISIGNSSDKQIEWYLQDRWLSTSYSIKVIDLDLKAVHRIGHWYELDQKIVNHAEQSQFAPKCVKN
ncbi:hypothetical protein VKS41_002629 [Umbelopsis sp. WA50703]